MSYYPYVTINIEVGVLGNSDYCFSSCIFLENKDFSKDNNYCKLFNIALLKDKEKDIFHRCSKCLEAENHHEKQLQMYEFLGEERTLYNIGKLAKLIVESPEQFEKLIKNVSLEDRNGKDKKA